MFKLTDEQQMILDTVRKIALKEIGPRAADLDETAGFPDHSLNAFAENGLLNPLLPAEYGGVETSFLTFSMILEEISRVCASSALLLIAQADGTLPIVHGGSEDLKAKYLNRLGGDSRALTALATTEPGSGIGRAIYEDHRGTKRRPICDQRPEVLHNQRVRRGLFCPLCVHGSREESPRH